MPSTRSRIRQSQDQSQSQADSVEKTRDAPPSKHKVDETFDSLSTAVLPVGYTIKLATTGDTAAISETQRVEQYVHGQEFLSDGFRRTGDDEGLLGDLIALRSRKRRRLTGVTAHGGEVEGSDKDVLWYTASMRHACACDLEPLPSAFTLRVPAPALAGLAHLSEDQDASEVVRFGLDIPIWHKAEDGYIDLEPHLDHLQEFGLGWSNASGAIWKLNNSSERFCEAFDDDDEEVVEEAIPDRPMVQETPANRWLRKGKFKAFDPFRQFNDNAQDTPIQVRAIVLETPYPPIRAQGPVARTEEEEVSEKAKADWEQECKRRKKLWRGMIGKDPGYGRFWDTLARPHSFPNLGGLANMPTPPDYNLFRKYHTASHPFHPDLHQYAQKNPYGRVYWLIPIHGPVIVPNLNDDVLTSPIATTEHEIPLPSSATFLAKSGSSPKIKARSNRPAPVFWTTSLLEHFIQSFLLPLRRSRIYGLSIVFSGPKPDPFIALQPPPQLVKHVHTGKSGMKANRETQKENMTAGNLAKVDSNVLSGRPARVEAGDHMRIYCDAKEALSLRTWLHGIHVDGQAGQSGNGEKGRRLFDKVRLCLIGEKGEVLIVA